MKQLDLRERRTLLDILDKDENRRGIRWNALLWELNRAGCHAGVKAISVAMREHGWKPVTMPIVDDYTGEPKNERRWMKAAA